MLLLLTLLQLLGSHLHLWSTPLTNTFTDVIFCILLKIAWIRLAEGRDSLERRVAVWAAWVRLLFAPEEWVLDRLHVQGHEEEGGGGDDVVQRDAQEM